MASGPLVGLDIGTQQIKVAEIRPVKGRLTVTALGIGPTPFGVMQNNIITDPQAMGQAIKLLMRESGVTAKKVVGSVAGQSAVVIRIIEVPRMTEAELRETMKWEVERHVPFAPNETHMAYQALDPIGPQADNNPNMEVLLAVAQQDIVANFIDTVFAAGLDPVAIDIEPLAASRALLEVAGGQPVIRPLAPPADFGADPYGANAAETVAIVNIGASNTDISIFQNGQLAFPRSLPLAGDSLTRAIAEVLGYPLDQAERIKRDHASVQLDRMAVYTGTAYGDDPTYEAPSFDDTDFVASSIPDDDVPLRNPFDLNADEPEATTFQTTPDGPQFDEPDRTQPIPQRTLNLARPLEIDTPGNSDDFSAPPAGGEATLRDRVFEAIAPVLGELSTELRRSLDYFRSRAQGRSVDRIVLTGGTAILTNFAQFLQNELQMPVTIADPLAGIDIVSKQHDPAYLHSISPVFTIAVGLAARDAVFDANPTAKTPKVKAAPKAAPGRGANVTNPPTS